MNKFSFLPDRNDIAAAILKEKQIIWSNHKWNALTEMYDFNESELTQEVKEIMPVSFGNEQYLRFQTSDGQTDLVALIPAGIICDGLSLSEFISAFRKNMKSILDCVKASIYISDDKANIIMINKEAEKTGGMRYEEILGKNMYQLVSQGFCTRSSSVEVLDTGMEQSIVQQSDYGKQLLITGVPCRKKDQIELVVTVERDLDEAAQLQKKLEDAEKKVHQYEGELEYLRNQKLNLTNVVYKSKAMENIVGLAIRMAQNNATVLIQGESGSGKEVIADIIYKNSSRVNKPFVKINCSAIPESLLESELFGYEKGAFTGAGTKGKIGLIELANNGTLFLDEISELSVKLQPKLLRVLQHGELIRVGGEKIIHVDVRIIAASNIDLEEAVNKGSFRKDLYYRLNVVPIKIPPLRERREDIIPLGIHFMNRFNQKYACNRRLDSEGSFALSEYHWPGNVRELENIIERVVITAENDSMVTQQIIRCLQGSNPYIYKTDQELTLPGKLAAFEKRIIEELYNQHRSVTKVALELGVSKSAICKKMKKYGSS